MTVPLFRPRMRTEEILAALRPILDSGWIGLGPRTAELEERLAELVGARHGVAVNSATAALHLSVAALGLVPGDEVLVPALTFASTAMVVLYQGARPVFVDVLPDTLCMDPEDAARKTSPATRGILPVHFAGHACAMDELLALASERGLWVVEDCAHALVGTYRGRPLGSLGAAGCLSFHAVKSLPTGDGGMVVTGDDALAARLRRLRWLGIDRDTWARGHGGRYRWRYSIPELGWKYHMNDIAATIGLVQLRHLEEDNRARAALAARYDELLAGLPGVERPVVKPYAGPAWHAYVIRVKAGQRDRLHEELAAAGVVTGVHYEPLHHHGVFDQRALRLPVTDAVWPELLTLPLYPDMTPGEQEQVVAALRSALGVAAA